MGARTAWTIAATNGRESTAIPAATMDPRRLIWSQEALTTIDSTRRWPESTVRTRYKPSTATSSGWKTAAEAALRAPWDMTTKNQNIDATGIATGLAETRTRIQGGSHADCPRHVSRAARGR